MYLAYRKALRLAAVGLLLSSLLGCGYIGYAVGAWLHSAPKEPLHPNDASRRELTRFVGTVLNDRARCLKNNAVNVPRCKMWLASK